jgi:type IV pilus biogenesis/stability protein PilW
MKRLCLVTAALVALSACASSSNKTESRDRAADRTVNPLYVFTLQQQGSVLLQQGRFEEALKRLEEAADLQPDNATTHNMIGLCNLRMERYDQALASFHRALEIVPSFTDARNNRGATYLSIGQYQLAEVDFVAVLSDTTYAHRSGVYYNLGMASLKRGQLGSAEENFRRATADQPPVFDAFLRIAEIASQQGRTDEAITVLEEARLKFPDRDEATVVLAGLLIDRGEPDRARPLLENVIANNPKSEVADRARELLERS